MPSKQTTFDTVVAHLRKQGRKAENDGECAYRGDGGDKCAAGCLIADEDYDPRMEGKAADHPLVGPAISRQEHDMSLVLLLQNLHDRFDVCDWESKFENIAKAHNLTYTPPLTLTPGASP